MLLQMERCVLWMGTNAVRRTIDNHSFENTRIDAVSFSCVKDH